MGTKIEWVRNQDGTQGVTWNPVTGCSRVSPGCEHCYAERLSQRFGWTSLPWTGPNAERNVRLHPERLEEPLHWRKPRTVFVCSMSDLFHEMVDEKYIAKVFAIIALTPMHTYQVLTKRPERMARLLSDEDFQFHVGWFASAAVEYYGIKRPGELPPWPYRHVWIGVTTEDQRRADERLPILCDTPAAVRFVSCEPLLGPIDLRLDEHGRHPDYDWGIDWVIVGSESGPGARPMDEDWVRSLRDQCATSGIPFFYKQRLDERGRKVSLPALDGQVWKEMPA